MDLSTLEMAVSSTSHEWRGDVYDDDCPFRGTKGRKTSSSLRENGTGMPNQSKPLRQNLAREKERDDALPKVAGTSTIMAPLNSRNGYVGPSLLRSRIGLKRSNSVTSLGSNDSDTSTKRPKVDCSISTSLFPFRSRPPMYESFL